MIKKWPEDGHEAKDLRGTLNALIDRTNQQDKELEALWKHIRMLEVALQKEMNDRVNDKLASLQY